MVTKIRPIASVEHSEGNDGRDAHDFIAYYCPTCNRSISYYRSDTACDQCGTFYDWGESKPYINYNPEIIW